MEEAQVSTASPPWTGRHRKAVPLMSPAVAALEVVSLSTADPAVREVESPSLAAARAEAARPADLQPAALLAAHLRAAVY